MHRTLAVIGCWLVLVSVSHGGDWGYYDVPGSLPIPRPSHNVKDWGPLDSDETPGAVPGGLVFIRQGNQRIWRFGGAALPMRIRITEPGSDGPVTTKMVLPSSAQSPLVPLALQHQAVPLSAQGHALPSDAALITARVQVSMPDPIGLLYLDGQLTDTRGTSRVLESPLMERGKLHVFRLRAGFKVGDNLLIEEKEVAVRAGEGAAVVFDGARAISVALPGIGSKPAVSQP